MVKPNRFKFRVFDSVLKQEIPMNGVLDFGNTEYEFFQTTCQFDIHGNEIFEDALLHIWRDHVDKSRVVFTEDYRDVLISWRRDAFLLTKKDGTMLPIYPHTHVSDWHCEITGHRVLPTKHFRPKNES